MKLHWEFENLFNMHRLERQKDETGGIGRLDEDRKALDGLFEAVEYETLRTLSSWSPIDK